MPSKTAWFAFVSACLSPAHAAGEPSGRIKHVVLLMLENRAFDHMCGWFPGVNGLRGNESNPLNTSDPTSPHTYVGNTSEYIAPFDPVHGLPATTQKIFGKAGEKEQKHPTMDGFIEYEHAHHKDPSSVLNMFTPDRVPIIKALADNFVLFDRFFAGIPGPTWPNRIMQLLGTSMGCTATSIDCVHHHGGLFDGKSVMDSLEEQGLDWRFYYHDAVDEATYVKKVKENPQNIFYWDHFLSDAQHGKLPAFSHLSPRWGVNKTTQEGSQTQHPDADVRLGEALLKEVYEALRNGAGWNETLLVVTYDEHGGFYDHVPPPMNIPAPDNSKPFPDEFDFTRLGIRIPTLAISPWVPKGLVEGRAQGPHADSEYDLTSTLNTIKDLFGLPHFLTKRDAWSGSYSHLITQSSQLRTDCPTELPPAPKSLGRDHAEAEAAKELNDLQLDMISGFVYLNPENSELLQKLPQKQGDFSEWAMAMMDATMRRVKEKQGALEKEYV